MLVSGSFFVDILLNFFVQHFIIFFLEIYLYLQPYVVF